MAPRPLPVVGGNLALDFANTVDNPWGPTRHDHLGGYDDLLAWSERAGTLPARLRPAPDPEEVLRRAHKLRDALNDVFGAAADGTGDLADRWPRLRPFVTEAMAAASLDEGRAPKAASRDGAAAPEAASSAGGAATTVVVGARWSWAGSDDPVAVLHPVAVAAAELLTGADLRLVKRCAGCPWLFVDRSRNHSRRWCDMADCGTVEKVQRYVARRRARL
ncbi:CGNR zinc finger domain-containing protein [Actinoplanes sp. NPDC049265]|uniref:CGNR zinc finger domain-containing protein n=1 Tax=Actinoplanes sp. NPDC049265 TaxID=3363902 RepID=UPI003713B9B9